MGSRRAELDSGTACEVSKGSADRNAGFPGRKVAASEIRALDAVMKVSGVRAMAELLGITQATVKTYLHNVFRKTGIARQSKLVKLIAGFEPAKPE